MIFWPILGSVGIASADTILDSRIQKYGRLVRTDRSFKIRALAARKLSALADQGVRGDPRIIGTLTAGLQDENALVRGMCIKGLTKHRAHGAAGRLTYLARFDPEDAVKNAAADAIEILKRHARVRPKRPTHRPSNAGPITVSLGRVVVEDAPDLTGPNKNVLRQTVRDAVEHQIQPHKPAIFPGQDSDLRLDVTVSRRVAEGTGDIQVEVRVVLVQMPEKHLRHTSRALARTKAKQKRPSSSLETQLALKALSRAVSDALALVYGSS